MKTVNQAYSAWCSEIADEINRICPDSIMQTGIGNSCCSISIVSPSNPRGDILDIQNWHWKIAFYYTRKQDDLGLYTDRFNPIAISSPLEVEWLPSPIKEWFVFNMDKFIGSNDAHREI
jgi:hypothetical protein